MAGFIESLERRTFLSAAPVPHAVPAGTPDAGFGVEGLVTENNIIGTGRTVAVQSDGKVIVAGTNTFDTTTFLPDTRGTIGVTRYNADGTLDTTFGIGGTATVYIGGENNSAVSLALQPDGKVIIAGNHPIDNFGISTNSELLVARLTASGMPDLSFGPGGTVVTDVAVGEANYPNEVTVQPDGKIVIAGGDLLAEDPDTTAGPDITRSHLFLLRYNADGTPDSTFGVNGRVVVDRLASNIADSGQAVAVQNDGRLLVVARQGTLGTIPALSVLRFNTNGTLDTTFGNAGEVATGIQNGGSITLQSDNKILITGSALGQHEGQATKSFPSRAQIVRLNPDGSFDSGFGTGGLVSTTFTHGGENAGSETTVQSDGSIVLAGWTFRRVQRAASIGLQRFMADGHLDKSFARHGTALAPFTVPSLKTPRVAMGVAPDGNVVVAGSSAGVVNGVGITVVRYTAAAVAPIAVRTGGQVTIYGANDTDTITAALVDAAHSPTGQQAVRITVNGVARTFAAPHKLNIRVLWPGHGAAKRITAPFSGTLASLFPPKTSA